jgi:hypothetical protein
MKQVFLSLVMLGATLTSYSQTSKKDSVCVLYQKDEMEDKTYYFPSQKIAIIDREKEIGFSVSAFIEEKGDELIVNEIEVKSVGIGSCVEKDELILLFEDDSKMKLTSWNKFNCEGNSWFSIGKSEIKTISTKKIKKIKFTNGRSYDSLTGEVSEDRQAYFCELFYALSVKKLKQAK